MYCWATRIGWRTGIITPVPMTTRSTSVPNPTRVVNGSRKVISEWSSWLCGCQRR